MFHIYTITDNRNNIIYVGKTNNIKRRWTRHQQNKKSCNYPLYHYMRNNNESFKIDKIETCLFKEDADWTERYWTLILKPRCNKQIPLRTAYQYNRVKKHCDKCNVDITLKNFNRHSKSKSHNN